MGHAKRRGIAAAVFSTFFISSLAHAGLIGTASVSDITLGGSAADVFQYASAINPQKGKNGTTTGFSGAFDSYGTGNWGLLSKFTSSAGNNSTASSGGLQLVFNKSDSRHGTWSVTNTNATQDLTLDLVFAMHAGNGSGAWLFDNQFIGAGATVSGIWDLNVFNDGRQYADYSNLTLFSRNAALTTPKPVVTTPVTAPATTPVNTSVTTPVTAPAAPSSGTAAAQGGTPSQPATPDATAQGGAGVPGGGAQVSTAPITVNPSAPSTPAAPAMPATATTVSDIVAAAQDIGGLATPSQAAAALGQTLAATLMPEILGNNGNNGNGGIGGNGHAGTVPEPASLGIMAAGLAMMAMLLRRRARQQVKAQVMARRRCNSGWRGPADQRDDPPRGSRCITGTPAGTSREAISTSHVVGRCG